ncbi:MAG: cell division protein ZapA [Bacillota bacterium]|nr:cell division protein ZapA [Bacillota bacterium]
MEEKNRVTVKIYGQEYTIAGEKSRDHIMRVADYVDEKMKTAEGIVPSGFASSLAVLAAINVADEYFSLIETLRELQARNQELEKDARHYVQLWDEAKKNFIQYKEDAQSSLNQKDELQQQLSRQAMEKRDLQERCRELEQRCESLKRRNEDLLRRVEAQEEDRESGAAQVMELENKCREIEANFFDLQMENIQLKGELERYKKIVE